MKQILTLPCDHDIEQLAKDYYQEYYERKNYDLPYWLEETWLEMCMEFVAKLKTVNADDYECSECGD